MQGHTARFGGSMPHRVGAIPTWSNETPTPLAMTRPKEIVSLSFGTPANYVAAHYWNAQQAYFDYGPDAPPPLVEHDVSFKAGLGVDGLDTYSPRALLFDVREEFGHLSKIHELYDPGPDEAFDGEVIQTHQGETNRSYWTDLAQTLFHPKSLVTVSASSLYGSSFLSNMGTDTQNPTLETFAQGQAIARAMDDEQRITEDTLRWWTEDTDLMQGFQLSASAYDAYGGIVCTYLDMLADEYPKTERHLTLLSQRIDHANTRYTAMNQVLSLVRALEHAHLVTPVAMEEPTPWPHVRSDANDLHRSAVLSTLLETATLPQRLMHRTDSMHTLRMRLQWHGDTRLAQLGGCMPTPLLAEERPDPMDALLQAMLAQRGIAHPPPDRVPAAAKRLRDAWWDASMPWANASDPGATPYAEAVVARDADSKAEQPTMDALAHEYPLSEPFVSRTFVPMAYPIEPTYPSILHGVTSDGRPWAGDEKVNVTSMPCISSLRTSPEMRCIIKEARSFTLDVLQGHAPLSMYGMEKDDRDVLVDVRETLETLYDVYGGVDDDQGPGTDEEWEVDAW